MASNFQPNWASPPGRTILRLMAQSSLSQTQLAERLDVSTNELALLLAGSVRLSADTAAKLADALGGSADYWLQRDADFCEDAKRIPIQRRYDAEWLKSMRYLDLVHLGWVAPCGNDDDKAVELLKFFDVFLSIQWKLRYDAILAGKAFRASANVLDKESILSAWLRYGELAASKVECKAWNRTKLHGSLDEIRKITRVRRPTVFIPELRRILSECGVALVVARTPPSCAASGATQFLNKRKALLLLSFRYKTDDQFWFSCFHELGHLLLHTIDQTFVDESMSARMASKVEKEANDFAANTLVPKKDQDEMVLTSRSALDIIRFARRIGIAPGIVVGQLQHQGKVARHHFHALKRRFSDSDIEEAAASL